jgi:hypothetical protein
MNAESRPMLNAENPVAFARVTERKKGPSGVSTTKMLLLLISVSAVSFMAGTVSTTRFHECPELPHLSARTTSTAERANEAASEPGSRLLVRKEMKAPLTREGKLGPLSYSC